MEAKALVGIVALCAIFAVGEGIKCYQCTRMEWKIVAAGDDYKKCEYPEKKMAPEEEDCMACAFDTREGKWEWVGRHCIKDDSCKNATVDQTTPGFSWVDDIGLDANFDVERVCCDTDLCNNKPFDKDGASRVGVTFSVLAAVCLSIFLQ